ncbi:ABC transporter ATP-binding protein [Candidatus Palauibacter soopunensis]|uniref:ABC transporter ATP-binding protein n=1 Tax=Candidatus Palauibacter soopunensis TaxID=3056739 RepID=UPI002382C0CF|nr:ABC transporter ATP-binding protein [Candidatus Palauibacter soopunensis]MDE2878456.1 ABC transporter ATP-binding protein [Candidatus Palauibacter soopunensis]
MIRDPHLRRALAYVRPYAGALLPVVLLSTAGTALGLALPYLSKAMIDDAILGGDFPLLLRIVGLFIGITILGFGANVASGMRYTRVSAGILFDMRLALYRHLQRLSPRFYARTPFGDIVSRINSDIGEIQRVTADAALGLFGNVLVLIGTVGMLIYLDARLFLAGLVVLPPSLWALVRYRSRLEGRVTHLRERSADIGSFLIETLQGVRTVVASNAQEREAQRFGRHNDRFVRALLSMRRYTYLAGGLPGVLLQTGTAAVFLYGGYRVITEATTLGTFVAFMAYQMRLLFPVQALMGLYANLASARASLVRVHELFDTPLEVVEADGAERLGRASGTLVLEDVRLGFGRGGEVLEGVSLEVPAGQVIALVGASGSGKSTIADLLSRQLDPDGGRVLLDGRDLRALALADVRRNVAVVEQDPFIFHASIAENVRYAKPDATDLEVAGALAAAALDGLMASLPEGAATVVGERGRQLSAGERQRVAVARAFLADPAVLVFDEATGALDPASEAQVLEGYAALMRGRTTVLITHRPELARRAERVVVLRDGRVAQDGRPAELDRRPGAFRALFAG